MNAKAYLRKIKVQLPSGKESNLYDQIKRASNKELKEEIVRLYDALKERTMKTEDHTTLLNTYAALLAMNLPKNTLVKVEPESGETPA